LLSLLAATFVNSSKIVNYNEKQLRYMKVDYFMSKPKSIKK
jgi:hypothetical protein